MRPLFQELLFFRTPRPSPLGKNGPNSVKAPPNEAQPGPEHKIHNKNEQVKSLLEEGKKNLRCDS